MQKRPCSPTFGWWTSQIRRELPFGIDHRYTEGVRDTADFDEKTGDETKSDLSHAILNAGLLHDVKFTGLVAAYRAQDLKEETERLSVKLKIINGKNAWSNMVFKKVYKDKYTIESYMWAMFA